MVNGNYALYGDRPSSESAIVNDHVHIRNDRKLKRKNHRTANELQHSLNLVQLDNDTDSVKYEKKIMEPKLLRYVPTSEVEENFVTEQFETYDLKPAEERTRRYGFTKKPKNPADGSVNYGYSAYSRSSSACSSPNANLPTIAEHGEQYTSYNVHAVSSPTINDLIAGYDTKLDKYFSKPREVKPFAAKGTHPDSLYRVPAEGNTKNNRFSRVLRLLRWPVALIAVCIALAVFVYFLMPDNLQSGLSGNDTYWELPVAAGVGQRGTPPKKDRDNKPSEIDFYEAENDKNLDFSSILNEESQPKNKPPIPPLFPTHLTPEVQYGNEKADLERRVPKFLEDTTLDDSTLIPHITQKPEKPLAIFFKEAIIDDTTAHAETITRAETVNDFVNYDQKQADKQFEDYPVKTHTSTYKEYVAFKNSYTTTEQDLYKEEDIEPESEYGFEAPDTFHRPRSNGGDSNFTSGHSNFFGISIEEAEKMQSTTQNALYNTRVSPTLPTWRDKDDTTTKKYPSNIFSDVQCRSTRLEMCRGLLPYDLAGSAKQLGDVEITSYMSQIEYLVATNCSDRVRHFVCALLEPECSPPPHPTKMPCFNLCKSIVDSCDGHIPQELTPAFDCKQYHHYNCVGAKVPCYAREFTCGDSTCIPQDWVCDGRKDCAAGEDEQKCRQCDSSEFKCSTGGCIQTRWVCDGYKDCPSGEDESESKCGSQHVLALERNEPGEESSGSAPPAFVRRPNKYPEESFKEDDKQSENDNSKELLVTSHSSNPRTVTRTYNPSPSPDRLRPYNHSSLQSRRKKLMKNEPVKSEIRNVEETEKPPRVMLENESYEPSKADELGLFDDFERDVKYGDPRPALEPVKPISFMHTKRPDKQTERTPIRLALKNTDNKFDVVIDGAALMKKANDENKAEAAEMERMVTMEKEDFSGDMKHGAHTSPCPGGELRCVDGRCITLAQLCDGTVDCSDHADEDNCYT